MRIVQVAFTIILMSLLCACKTPERVRESGPSPAAETNTSGLGTEGTRAGESLSDEEVALRALAQQGTIIYFDYDREEIKDEYIPVLKAHAKFLNAYSKRQVRLEGHSDERGSREYNIALGNRRAQAVRRALSLQGVSDAQITVLSYGEERPATSGHDESAWRKNRRVEFVY